MHSVYIRWTFVAFALLLTPRPAAAFDESHGGYAATAGVVSLAATAPLAGYLAQTYASPRCPECSRSVADWAVIGALGIGTVGVAMGLGWLAGELAQSLSLSPDVGWFASGITVGAPVGGTLFLSAPSFEPIWLHTSLGLVSTGGGAVAGGWHAMRVSRSRGHAWPEFAMGHGGMAAGALVGTLLCGGESCFATPLSIGLGGLTGVVLATAFFGTDASSPQTRSMPLMLLYF